MIGLERGHGREYYLSQRLIGHCALIRKREMERKADDPRAAAEAHLSKEIAIAIEREYPVASVIEYLIDSSQPIPADEVREIVSRRYAEAEIERERREAQIQADLEAMQAAIDAVDVEEKRKELEQMLRAHARSNFLHKKATPQEVLASAGVYNTGYAYALDTGSLMTLVAEEYERVRKTRLPVTKLSKHEDHYTEMGLAERFVAAHWEEVLFCHQMKTWLIWDKRVWVPDRTDAIRIRAKATARRLYAEVSQIEDDQVKRALLQFAKKAESARTLTAMLELARSEVPISVEELDMDSNLFNVRNGTIELDEVRFREHRPEDYLTKMADVDFDEKAECPLWLAHLDRIFAGDREAIDGFQQMCGYTLLADNPAEVFFILYGTGANGKSKTLEILSTIWGAYSKSADSSKTLLKRRHADGPKTELADLVGARLVTTSESAEGARLDEEAVKAITGRDRIKVRRLYEREFEYVPGYKIWYATNHRPVVSTDPSIWRRIWLVPFTVTIPPEERDEAIAERLLAERSGILNWCLAGLKAYHDAGSRLVRPSTFAVATEEYRLNADAVSRFLDEECIITGNQNDREVRSDLYAAYKSFVKDNGGSIVSAEKFSAVLKDRGVVGDPKRARLINAKGETEFVRYWLGIKYKTNDERRLEWGGI